MGLIFVFVKKSYHLLKSVTNLYFLLVNFVVDICMLFSPRKAVKPTDNKLLLIPANEAAAQIRKKMLKSLDLVNAYIERIEEVNPQINAMIRDNFEAARKEAQRVDERIAESDEFEIQQLAQRKPLFGVPFSCKDNMKVEGFVTVAGNPKFVNNPPNQEDAEVIRRIRDSGAILICLTNLPKMAMNWNCTNEVFGQTNNPYDLRRVPGGSSGGEAALIASAGSLFGPGNDLAGSVRIPAAFCNIFGLKPTMDLVSLEGFVPEIKGKIANEQWNIGPLCRYADDLPVVLEAMVGAERLQKCGVKLESPVNFRDIRFFYMEELKIVFVESVHADMKEAVRKTRKYFEQKFDVIPQSVDFNLVHHMYEIWGAMRFDDTKLRDIFEEIRKYFKNETDLTNAAIIFSISEFFLAPSDEIEEKVMLERRQRLKSQIIRLLGADGLLILPAFPTSAPFHNVQPFCIFNVAYNQLFNILGLPAIVCPLGLNSDGIPTSVQLVGAPHTEGLLIAAAQELEHGGLAGWVQPGRG